MRLALGVVIALCAGAGAAADTAQPASTELAPRANITRIEHKPAGEVPSRGPSTAPVTIELYFIPGLSPGRQPFELLRQLQAAHPSRVRVVYRMLQRANNLLAPLAAAEAGAQGRFFEFMALLVKKQGTRREQILDVARAAGLDVRRLEVAWADGRHEAALAANEARRKRLTRTSDLPSLTINGVVVSRRLAGLDLEKLEALYLDAHDRAMDQLDRGVPAAHLAQAFERALTTRHQDQVLAPGPIDDADPSEPLDAPPTLVTVPIDTRGWPSIGPADAAVPIVVLCNLRTIACRSQIVSISLGMRDLFGDDVRVVWAPMFDPAAEDAAATTLINDAALCAEELGSGWSWVEQAVNVTHRRHGRPGDPDKEIDAVIAATELDRGAVARCLAASAGASARVVARIRASGVRSGPSLVVGGRIYPGGVADPRMLQALVEDELAPGILEDLAPDWTAR